MYDLAYILMFVVIVLMLDLFLLSKTLRKKNMMVILFTIAIFVIMFFALTILGELN